MHGPVKQNTPAHDRPASSQAPVQHGTTNPPPHGPQDRTALQRAADADDQEQIRDALHMVLNVNVYDCAGRAVTVKDMLRGSLATMVRVALDGRRGG